MVWFRRDWQKRASFGGRGCRHIHQVVIGQLIWRRQVDRLFRVGPLADVTGEHALTGGFLTFLSVELHARHPQPDAQLGWLLSAMSPLGDLAARFAPRSSRLLRPHWFAVFDHFEWFDTFGRQRLLI